MIGGPVDRFSKEGQPIGEGQGRLSGKDELGAGLWSLDRLWMDAGWRQPIQAGRGQTLDADSLLCNL